MSSLDPFHCEFQHRTYKLSIGVRNSFLSAKNIFWFCCLVMLALPCQLFLRLVIYMATVKDFEPEPLFLSVLLSIIPANICSWSEFEFTIMFHKHSITSALFQESEVDWEKGIISHFGIHLGNHIIHKVFNKFNEFGYPLNILRSPNVLPKFSQFEYG